MKRPAAIAVWTATALLMFGSTFLVLAAIASLSLESEWPGDCAGFAGIGFLLASLAVFWRNVRRTIPQRF